MKLLTIKRKQWLRGHQGSKLYRSFDRRMCCLGFYCRSLGFKTHEINDINNPAGVVRYSNSADYEKTTIKLGWLLSSKIFDSPRDGKSLMSLKMFDSIDGKSLMYVNDSMEISEPVREERISTIFKRHGVKVKFV